MSFLSKLFLFPLTAKEKPGINIKTYENKGTYEFIVPMNTTAIKVSLYSSEDNLYYEFVKKVFGGEKINFEVQEDYSIFTYQNSLPITVKNLDKYSSKLIIKYQTY